MFNTLSCISTVPATSQITYSKAISSTSIKFEWSNVIGADSYNLFVEKLFSFPAQTYNQTFTTLSGQVDGLNPSTTYNCYIYSSNSAGRGAKSTTRTITTCKCTWIAEVPNYELSYVWANSLTWMRICGLTAVFSLGSGAATNWCDSCINGKEHSPSDVELCK